MTQAWPTYPAPRKLALVVSCVDYRLLDDIVSYLHLDNMTNRYYHSAIAGTALSLVEHLRPKDFVEPKLEEIQNYERANIKTEPDLMKLFCAWKRTFFDQVKAGLILTKQGISDIYIIQHENCGAFRIYLNKDIEGKDKTKTGEHLSCEACEIEMHQWYAVRLKQQILAGWDSISQTIFDEQWPISERFGVDCEKKAEECSLEKTGKPFEVIRGQSKPPEIHLLYMTLRGEMLNLEEWEPDPKTYKVKEKKKSKKSKDTKKSE